MEAIAKLKELSIDLHLLFIAILLSITIRLFFLLRSKEGRVSHDFLKSYDRWTLFYRATLSAVIFSGVVVMAIFHFHTRWQVWLMVLFCLYLLYQTIKEYILYKERREDFFYFSKQSYIISFIGIAILVVVSIV